MNNKINYMEIIVMINTVQNFVNSIFEAKQNHFWFWKSNRQWTSLKFKPFFVANWAR